MATNPHRLARTVVPVRYDLTLAPDLDRRDFIGRSVATVQIHEPTNVITCNADELEIKKVWAVDHTGTRTDAISIDLDSEKQRVTATFGRTLPTGDCKITYEFVGVLNDRLAGFYASTYTDADGASHTIAATQFESTDARRAFPCWDEPDFKAIYGVTLVVNDGLMAISNEPVLSEAVLSTGKRSITFHDSMIMSTYLLCFVVGELEATGPVDVGGVPLRIIHRPGQSHLTAFALEIGAFSLKYFASYYDIAYPGKKMDFIALPDFAAGAMENLGAVTYRETLLLVDPTSATHTELERIADVVAHEVAHMWFGDLVTMSWWNGLWLNEAFATFAEISCVAAFRPEWDRWTSFGVARSSAMTIDALHSTRPIEYPVVSPTDAEGMFDVLTYEKGASVLRQLEMYLGEDRFRDGVRAYLRKHAYANSETSDLFDAIQQVTGEPVAEMMNGWIFTGGFPLVSCDESQDGAGVTLSQQRFTFLPDATSATWQIPVLWRTIDDGSPSSGRVNLGVAAESIAQPGGVTATVINAGGHGFYRVRYDDAMLMRLSAVLDRLPPIERFSIVSDTWAAVLSGAVSAEAFIRLAESLNTERDPNVWAALLEGLGTLNQIAADEARPALHALIGRIAQPVLDDLSWNPEPGESALIGQLRGKIIETLGVIVADDAVRSKAAEYLPSVIAGDDTGLGSDVEAAVIFVAARNGDVARWQQYFEAMKSAATPQQTIRFLQGLAAFEDPALRQKSLLLMLSDDVRSQDAPYALIRMSADRVNGPDTWNYMRTNWDALVAHVPSTAVVRMTEGLTRRTEPDLPADIRSFFAAHPIPQGVKQLEQNLERLKVNERLREREGSRLTAILSKS